MVFCFLQYLKQLFEFTLSQVVISAVLACLGEYSHANNLAKRMIGMYMYASGAQQQAISVLSTLGLSESYSNLISKNVRHV